MAGHKRKRGHAHEEHHDERWLLTYADMITLLMALFIVMWAISSVNTSKFKMLRQSLHEAFAGQLTEGGDGVLEGGRQVLQPEGARVQPTEKIQKSPDKVLNEKFSRAGGATGKQANADLDSLKSLAREVDAYAKAHGLEGQIRSSIDERGLVVRLLTDKVLFEAGQATVKREALPLLTRIGALIRSLEIGNPIRVEGNTDSTPISTSQFRSNWELSTARATAVLQVLLASHVPPRQLSAAGYAEQRPVATNATADGRYRNRHVDIVVLRRGPEGATP